MTVNDVIAESLRIERIMRQPTTKEVDEYRRFMTLPVVTIPDLEQFVSVYQPGAHLRNLVGEDLIVGTHFPPAGGPTIKNVLQGILDRAEQVGPESLEPFWTHIEYERLHPFMDCNGRSGRMLWFWQMRDFPLGFLHTFYYQTLRAY